jgi:eukaryotic-like serine/threonine-protein kinase
VLVLALLAVTAVFLATRTEKGTGDPVVKKPRGLTDIRLAGNAASDYDPEGDNTESPNAARNAIDGNLGTNWNTETYQGGFEGSNKSGVGLYVDAGSLMQGRGLTLATAKPGFRAAVYASETVPANLRGWTRLSPVQTVEQDHTFRLRTRGRVYRYYLLWISRLPDDGEAQIQELSLLR